MNTSSWRVISTLLNALILSVALYAAPVWALHYLEEIEKTQLKFCKRILNLSRCTPVYGLRTDLQLLQSLSLSLEGQKYLNLSLPLYIKKIFAQVRLSNNISSYINLNNNIFKFKNSEICCLCNDIYTFDTILHFIFECQKLEQLRLNFFKSIQLDLISDNWSLVLNPDNATIIRKFVNFLINALSLRNVWFWYNLKRLTLTL